MTKNITETLANIISTKQDEISNWFETKLEKTNPFFYNSVDLRYSGFKLAPVDTNLFPAGFNNLSEQEFSQSANIAANFFAKYYPNAKNILIIAEDHTRNLYYLENLYYLREIINNAGLNAIVTNLSVSNSGETLTLNSVSGKEIQLKPIKKLGDKLITLCGLEADFVLVNNDLTEGSPKLLQNLQTPISPPTGFGWYRRRKTSHFDSYNQLAREFSNQFDIDPWLISTYFRTCGVVNFKEKKGIECVALAVDKTINLIKKKYDEYGIKEKPYVFVKSDKGTYGMGIMTASSGEEMYEMGKKIRNKMNTIKSGVANTEVIIQEGVPTIDKVNDSPAEPMIYMVGGDVAGSIFRVNKQKDSYNNLNSKGMEFLSIADYNNDENTLKVMGLVAKLASYAAALECYESSYSI